MKNVPIARLLPWTKFVTPSFSSDHIYLIRALLFKLVVHKKEKINFSQHYIKQCYFSFPSCYVNFAFRETRSFITSYLQRSTNLVKPMTWDFYMQPYIHIFVWMIIIKTATTRKKLTGMLIKFCLHRII